MTATKRTAVAEPESTDGAPEPVLTGAKVFARLADYVRTGDPSQALERLDFAAAEAARTATIAGGGKTTAVMLLTLAAECAGVGRATAEQLLAAAFKGVRR